MMVPVELDENGNIPDGHHRMQIIEELGITDYPTITRTGMTEEEKRPHARQLNMARRQLTRKQRRELILEQMQETPEMSDRRVAEGLGVSHTTVGAVREKGERLGQIDQVGTGVDKLGRNYPKDRKPALTPQRNVEAVGLGPEDMWVDVEAPPMRLPHMSLY